MDKIKTITKRYKDEIFVWDPTSFQGRGYWYVLGTKGGYGRAASKKESTALGRPLGFELPKQKPAKETYVKEIKPTVDDTHEDVEEIEPTQMTPEEMKAAAKRSKRAGYAWGRRTRKRSLTDLFTEQILEGKGVFSSVGGAIGMKVKAKKEGFKEFFDLKEKLDPLNIAKKLTGGSVLGPVLLGRLLGRSAEDIAHFADTPYAKKFERRKQKATLVKSSITRSDKLAPVPQENNIHDVADRLYGLFGEYFDENRKHREHKASMLEEERNESDRRHKALIDALVSIGAKKPKKTATPVGETAKQDNRSLWEKITDLFDNFTSLKNIVSGLQTISGAVKTVLQGIWGAVSRVFGFFGLPFLIGAAPLAVLGLAAYAAAGSETGGNTENQTKVMKKLQDIGDFKQQQTPTTSVVPEEDMLGRPGIFGKYSRSGYDARKSRIQKSFELGTQYSPEDAKRIKTAYGIDVPKENISEPKVVPAKPKPITKEELKNLDTNEQERLRKLQESPNSGSSYVPKTTTETEKQVTPKMQPETQNDTTEPPEEKIETVSSIRTRPELGEQLEISQADNLNYQLMQSSPTSSSIVRTQNTQNISEKDQTTVVGSGPVRNNDDTLDRILRQNTRMV